MGSAAAHERALARAVSRSVVNPCEGVRPNGTCGAGVRAVVRTPPADKTVGGMNDERLSTDVVAGAVASGSARIEAIGSGHALATFVGKTLQHASENWPWNDTFAALILRIRGGTSVQTKQQPEYQPHSEWWNFGWTVMDVECEEGVLFDPNTIMLHSAQAAARARMTIRSIHAVTIFDARDPLTALACKPGPIVFAKTPQPLPTPAAPRAVLPVPARGGGGGGTRSLRSGAWGQRNPFARDPTQLCTVRETTASPESDGKGTVPDDAVDAQSCWDPPLRSLKSAGKHLKSMLLDVDFMDPDAD